jgi:hypothetical protein
VVLSSGWHPPYAPNAVIRCDAPDGTGEIAINAGLVDGFLDRTWVVNRGSHILRYTRTSRPHAGGEFELTVGWVRNLQLEWQ